MEDKAETAGPAHPGESSQPPSVEDLKQLRRERREMRKLKRQEERIRKQLEAIRAPQSKKVNVITTRIYEKFQNNANKADVKNKLFQASQSTFALTDFIVEKQIPEKPRPRKKTTSGTVVPSLRKGKIREIPKRKALTRLKRSILAIRERRRKELGESKSHEIDKTKTAALEPPVADTTSADPVKAESINYSRKYRSYCDHPNDLQVAKIAEEILKDLFRFQNRAYEKNQIKARAHRRYVVGFKEVQRHMEVNKVKLLLLATDMEPSPGQGGIDELVERLKEGCSEKDIPYCFPLQRRRIGYLLLKKAPVSCVGILDPSGAEENVKELLGRLTNLRTQFGVPEMQKLEIK